MRKLFFTMLACLVSSQAWASIIRIQSKANFGGSGTTCAATFSSSSAAIDHFVVGARGKLLTSTASFMNTLANAFSSAARLTTGAASEVESQIFYAKKIVPGPDTATVTYQASTPRDSEVILEPNGVHQNLPLDITSTDISSNSSFNTNPVRLPSANELTLGAGTIDAGTSGAGSGFGTIRSTGGDITEDSILISNAQQHATASSSSSGDWGMKIATFRDSSNLWSGSKGIAEPQPWHDVTAYGATGTGNIHDDTTAIQAAITAACTDGGSVFFPAPPGHSGIQEYYMVSQPQLPSTAPVFTTCSGLHVFALGNTGGGAGQFSFSPQAKISVQNFGANPNAAPVFQIAGNSETFENIGVVGYNQAFGVVTGSTGAVFRNVSAAVVATGDAFNCPYYVTGSLWDYWYDSSGQTPLTTGGAWCFDDTLGSQPVSAMYIIGGRWIGGSLIQYTNDVIQSASGPGSWHILNMSGEQTNGAGTDLISITNPSGLSFPLISNITVENVFESDSACSNCAVINMNASGTLLEGVTITNSFAGSGGIGVAIRQTAGGVQDWHTECGSSFCVGQAVDVNGNPLQKGIGTNPQGGRDFVALTSDANRLNSNFAVLSTTDAPMARFFSAGNPFSGLALDAAAGTLFGDLTNWGYSANLSMSTQGILNIGFAQLMPPTSLNGTLTSGGSLTVGTALYYTIRSSHVNCGGAADESAPSSVFGPITPTTGNQSVVLTWVLAPTGTESIAGYCVTRSTTSTAPLTSGSIAVSGASTATYTDTGTSMSGGANPLVNTFQSVHAITPTSIGIGTTSPTFNLDVTGTGRLTGALTIGGGSATNKILMGSGTLTYTAISAQTCQEKTFTLAGSATTGIATASPAASLGSTNLSWSARVSATNTVNVRVCNPSSSSITPSAVTWNVRVAQ